MHLCLYLDPHYPSPSPNHPIPYSLLSEASVLAEHSHDPWHPRRKKKFDSWSPFLSMFHTLYCMRALIL